MSAAEPVVRARPTLRDWLSLCRVSNLPTVWMNVLAALALASASSSAADAVRLAISMSAFYTAGMCWNDVFDRALDAVAKPGRPIPSGRIGVGPARALGTGLLVAGLALLAWGPHPSAWVPGLGLAVLILVYDLYHKAHPVTVLAMAGCRVGVFVACAWSVAGGVPWLVWVGAAASFLHTLAVTAVARYENARAAPFGFPVIPAMIAAMSLTDGIVLAILVHPVWLVVGAAAAGLTWLGQRYVRGD